MQKIKTKVRRLTYKIKHDYFNTDNIILSVAVVLVLAWTYSAIIAISRNWTLEQNLTTQKKELALLQLEVDSAELENEYFKSAEYQELAARRQQNKKLAGETMIYLPENSEYARNKHQTTTAVTDTIPSNFAQWINFLFNV